MYRKRGFIQQRLESSFVQVLIVILKRLLYQQDTFLYKSTIQVYINTTPFMQQYHNYLYTIVHQLLAGSCYNWLVHGLENVLIEYHPTQKKRDVISNSWKWCSKSPKQINTVSQNNWTQVGALTALCREKSAWLTWKRGHLRTDQQMRMQLPVHEQTEPELLSDISPRDSGRGEGLWQRRRRLTSAASSSQHLPSPRGRQRDVYRLIPPRDSSFSDDSSDGRGWGWHDRDWHDHDQLFRV